MVKILYGVQGTGNGHIARARMMAAAFKRYGLQTHFLFSGRPKEAYFDMACFEPFEVYNGLTFHSTHGKVSYFKTLQQTQFIRFIEAIRQLDLSDYDLVISDFEPISAWAAKRQGKTTLAIGNQYAYRYNIPRKGSDPLAEWILRYFAPAQYTLALHWHHFGHAILPPIIPPMMRSDHRIANKIVVYLPFEDNQDVIEMLAPFDSFEFYLSSTSPGDCHFPHIHYIPMSCEHFQQALSDSCGVICNAGFALVSEALQLGKKILVKPLHAQMEQTSNALALHQLGYAQVMESLDQGVIEKWLNTDHAVQITYPDTADMITQWIIDGMPAMSKDAVQTIWDQVDVMHIRHH